MFSSEFGKRGLPYARTWTGEFCSGEQAVDAGGIVTDALQFQALLREIRGQPNDP
jgi:hypothetical protein